MYRWLLQLYPASFRNEYGREMATVFARERRDTGTALGLAALWLRVIADTCVNAAGIHWDILRQDLHLVGLVLVVLVNFTRRMAEVDEVAARLAEHEGPEPVIN